MKSYLSTHHIAQSTADVEWHPLLPFLPSNGKILFLGSFPPQRKRWCMDFYYPNFINDHWRIEGEVFYADRQYFVDQQEKRFRLDAIIEHCERCGIGFYDTATAIRRLNDNASDKYLEVVEPTDIPALAGAMPELRAIVVTGEKAATTICQRMGIAGVPKVNTFTTIPQLTNANGIAIELYRLPSSSRAYPLAFDKKATAYKAMFNRYNINVQNSRS